MVILFLEDFRNPPEVNIRCHCVLRMASFILYLFNFPALQKFEITLHRVQILGTLKTKKGTSVNKALKKKNFA